MGATITRNASAVDPAIAGKGYATRKCSSAPIGSPTHLDDPDHPDHRERRGRAALRHRPHSRRAEGGLAPGPERPVLRDYVRREQFEKLLRTKGSTRTRPSFSTATRTTGGRRTRSGCFSCSASPTRSCSTAGASSGSRKAGRSTPTVPQFPATSYRAPEALGREDSRLLPARCASTRRAGKPLVDVRSPEEYTGSETHMPDYPQEGTLRGGHIQGARVCRGRAPRTRTARSRPRTTLRAIYEQEKGLKTVRRHRRLLPHRRALVAHLVRAHATCSATTGPQLRRQLDRVGQRGARAHRKGRRRGDGTALRCRRRPSRHGFTSNGWARTASTRVVRRADGAHRWRGRRRDRVRRTPCSPRSRPASRTTSSTFWPSGARRSRRWRSTSSVSASTPFRGATNTSRSTSASRVGHRARQSDTRQSSCPRTGTARCESR